MESKNHWKDPMVSLVKALRLRATGDENIRYIRRYIFEIFDINDVRYDIDDDRYIIDISVLDRYIMEISCLWHTRALV